MENQAMPRQKRTLLATTLVVGLAVVAVVCLYESGSASTAVGAFLAKADAFSAVAAPKKMAPLSGPVTVPDVAPAVAPKGLREGYYAGSVDYVLEQQKVEFDVWQVGTLADYPWLAEQLGVDVSGTGEAAAKAANDRFCAKTPQYCSSPVVTRAGNPVMAAAADDFVPDMQRRTIMNLVLLGGAGVPVLWLGGGFVYFFVPPSGGGGGGGVSALDAQGDAVVAAEWAKIHPYPSRSLVQGLKGDAHYLIVKSDGSLEDYAINAVCTHLGCVVPWNRAANKYMCPCHGSQYDPTGKVIRGPAPLSLALAHLEQPDGKVVLTPWTETDFRTDQKPWWK
jgi:cytochrome b6-f complex iron-sulfur subunit